MEIDARLEYNSKVRIIHRKSVCKWKIRKVDEKETYFTLQYRSIF